MGERDRESEAARVMGACDAILGTLTNFETVQVLSTEQRSAIVKAAAGKRILPLQAHVFHMSLNQATLTTARLRLQAVSI